MNEQMIVANLLNDTKQVQFLKVDYHWFESNVMAEIVKAVVGLNGEIRTTVDLVEQIKESRTIEIGLDQLETLKSLEDNEKYSFVAMVPHLKKRYLQKE